MVGVESLIGLHWSLYHGLDLDGSLLKLLLFLPVSGQLLLGGLLLCACKSDAK